MGLFSWLFKKKKEEPKPQERHFIDDVPRGSKVATTRTKTKAETRKPSSAKAQQPPKSNATSEQKVIKKEEAEADKISTDKNAETVKVKGYGGAFDIKRSKDGRYVFNLYAANRVIVATSQIYSSSQSSLTGIKSVIANAERAGLEDQTVKGYTTLPYPKWEIYVDKGGQFRWRLLATNGSCILHSQGYTQKSTCKKGIESVIRTVKSAKIDKSYLDKK